MTDAQAELLKTIVWAFVAVAGINAFTIYTVVRLFATGRGIFERKDQQLERERIVRPGSFGSER